MSSQRPAADSGVQVRVVLPNRRAPASSRARYAVGPSRVRGGTHRSACAPAPPRERRDHYGGQSHARGSRLGHDCDEDDDRPGKGKAPPRRPVDPPGPPKPPPGRPGELPGTDDLTVHAADHLPARAAVDDRGAPIVVAVLLLVAATILLGRVTRARVPGLRS
jgi:hypothetical protein